VLAGEAKAGLVLPATTTIRKCLKLPDNELVVCGMSVGYADDSDRLGDREPVEGGTDFRGF
jgi:hypothetical protein